MKIWPVYVVLLMWVCFVAVTIQSVGARPLLVEPCGIGFNNGGCP